MQRTNEKGKGDILWVLKLRVGHTSEGAEGRHEKRGVGHAVETRCKVGKAVYHSADSPRSILGGHVPCQPIQNLSRACSATDTATLVKRLLGTHASIISSL